MGKRLTMTHTVKKDFEHWRENRFFFVCTVIFVCAVFILRGRKRRREGKVWPAGIVEAFAEKKIHTHTHVKTSTNTLTSLLLVTSDSLNLVFFKLLQTTYPGDKNKWVCGYDMKEHVETVYRVRKHKQLRDFLDLL